jgi:DNA polymerase-3 subunit beta
VKVTTRRWFKNIVEPRQTVPILANALVEAAGDSVRLTATDLDVGARVAVPAKVARPVRSPYLRESSPRS